MALGPDEESVAKALGVSRNAWRKWMAKDSLSRVSEITLVYERFCRRCERVPPKWHRSQQ